MVVSQPSQFLQFPPFMMMIDGFPRHIMTGIGAYFYITWGMWLRHCLNGKQDLYELYWPNLVFSLPAVVLKDQSQAKNRPSIANGNHKKEL